jgi:hypothetical protein
LARILRIGEEEGMIMELISAAVMGRIFTALMIVGPAIAFSAFVRFHRATKTGYTKTLGCPRKRLRANVAFTVSFENQTPHCNVAACSLLEEGQSRCDWVCLPKPEVLDSPFRDHESRD